MSSNIHVVRIAVFSRAGDVLLLRRSGTDRWKPYHWNLPGGKVDLGEDPVLTAERELAEESGLFIPGNLLQHRFDVTVGGRTTRIFAALIPFPVPASGSDGEHDLFTWASLTKLPDPLIPGTQEILASLSIPM